MKNKIVEIEKKMIISSKKIQERERERERKLLFQQILNKRYER